MKTANFTNAVLITGANRGMGLGYVRHYLKAGYKVIGTFTQSGNAMELCNVEKQYPNDLLITELDVSSEDSIAALAACLREVNATLSIAINNAGISLEEGYGNWTLAQFENHFRINTIGPALVTQAIEPFMNSGSKLVQISSGMGSIEWNINTDAPLDAYAASKCALNILTVRLAAKLQSKGIIVVALNPGWVKTDMGGEAAPTSVEEAIGKITKTIDGLSPDNTGCFLSEDGETVPW